MIVLGTLAVRECPESYITDWSRDVIGLFHLSHSICPSFGGPVIIPGPLPDSGGVFDQDNATMEAFQVIRNELLAMSESSKPVKKR